MKKFFWGIIITGGTVMTVLLIKGIQVTLFVYLYKRFGLFSIILLVLGTITLLVLCALFVLKKISTMPLYGADYETLEEMYNQQDSEKD